MIGHSTDVFLIVIAALVLRALPRFIAEPKLLKNSLAGGGDVGDAVTHLLLIDLIRRNDGRLVLTTPSFTLSGPQDYPAFFHMLMARVPRAVLERWEWLSSPVFEAIHAALIYLFVHYWCKNVVSVPDPRVMAFLITTAWFFTPGFVRDPRRGSYLNERVFGFLFGHLFFLMVLVVVSEHSWTAAGVAVLAGAVVAVSSKFGMQSLVFITPLASLLLWDWRPIALLVVSFSAAVLLSRGYAITVWRGTLRHSSFYARFLVNVHDYTTSFTVRSLVVNMQLLLSRGFRLGTTMLRSHPLPRAILDVPSIWIALALLVPLWALPAAQELGLFVASASIIGISTMTDQLKFLGEGERYLEYAVLASLLMFLSWPIYGVVAISAVAIYGLLRQTSVLRTARRTRSSRASTFDELAAWLSMQRPQTFLTIPGRLCYPLAYRSFEHRFVWWFINAPDASGEQRWRGLFDDGGRYPFPSPSRVKQGYQTYGADLVILHKPAADGAREVWGFDYSAVGEETVFENFEYKVVRTHGSMGAGT